MIYLGSNMFGDIVCPDCKTRHVVCGTALCDEEECNCTKCGKEITVVRDQGFSIKEVET